MIHLYSIHGDTLKDEGRTIDVEAQITGMDYSDDGAHLAVINDKKALIIYSVADDYAVNTYCTQVCLYTYPLSQVCHLHSAVFQVKNVYHGHHAKPVSLAWCPDNEHLATGGMDMMVYVWTVCDTEKRIKLAGKPCSCRGRTYRLNSSFIIRCHHNSPSSVLWLSL